MSRWGWELCLFTLTAALLWAGDVAAVEVVVQNDSAPLAGGGTSLPNFLSGESAGAWLTAPVTGTLVAVQIDWRSSLGGSPSTIETAITVFAGGTFPTPGASLAVVSTPTLTDTGINEFRFLDPGFTVPLQVPLTAGQSFVIALEFFNTQSQTGFTPSVTYDGDGCQSGRNAALTLPPGTWFDACLLGVPGDLVIRAVVDVPAAQPCGDGFLDPGEECDDGNTTSFDGCSSFCQLEGELIPTIPPWGLLTLAGLLLGTSGYLMRGLGEKG